MAYPTNQARRYRYTAGSPDIRLYPEAATQTFQDMEMVNLASQKVQRIVGISTTVTSGDAVLGMALADASGVTNTNIPVLLANNSVEFAFPANNTTASVATSITFVGLSCALYHTSTTGYYAASTGSTSNPAFQITEIDANDAVGTTGGYLWGKIPVGARQIA